jgi:hypothetical protein
VYHRRASAWSRNTGLTTVDPKAFQTEADRVAAYARSVAVPRLQQTRRMARDYDAKGTDLKERAARFPDTVECSG